MPNINQRDKEGGGGKDFGAQLLTKLAIVPFVSE